MMSTSAALSSDCPEESNISEASENRGQSLDENVNVKPEENRTKEVKTYSEGALEKKRLDRVRRAHAALR